MAGRIVVVRERRWGGLVPPFAVRIDGRKVGTVGFGKRQGFDVEPGTHRVRTSQLGYSSKTLVVSVAEGETVVVRTGVRFWGNSLNALAGGLIGGVGYWLFGHGATPNRVAGFSAGLALAGIIFAARLMIYLRPDPTAERRFGQTDISTDTIRRR